MEKNGKIREKEFAFLLLCLLCCKIVLLKEEADQPQPYDEKNEQAYNSGLTKDRGLSHGQSVVSSISILFCFFFLPLA